MKDNYKTSKMFKTVSIVILIILLLSFVSYLCYCNESFIVESFTKLKEFFELGEFLTLEDGTIFRVVGTGPAIDVTVMTEGQDGLINSWQSNAQSVPYKNHEDITISLSPDQFRAINGFIPPSFSFFPFGPDNDEYRPPPDEKETSILDAFGDGEKTYREDEGRRVCLQACQDTNCIAVQTEVPQLCYSRRVSRPKPTGYDILGGSGEETHFISQGDCKGKATHACTLFYRNIPDADDAYFEVSGGEEALLDPNLVFKGGLKYYDKSRLPNVSPGSGKPSEEIVKWCDAKVERGDTSSRYKTAFEAPEACTCEGYTTTCDDPNCCVYRNLLTTNWAKHNTPYYHLPLNVTTVAEGGINAICTNVKNYGANSGCCGICDDGNGGTELVSCNPNHRFLDGTEKNTNIFERDNYWKIETDGPGLFGESYCTENSWWDETWDVDDNADAECMEEYQDNYGSSDMEKAIAYRKLLQCCNYKDQACVGASVQPLCSTGGAAITSVVEQGCFGDPQILNVDNVIGDIGACSDSAIIPPENRCIQDVEGKVCKAFPYGCESGPLWKIQ